MTLIVVQTDIKVSIVGIVDLTKIYSLNELYKSLCALKKDAYADDERIIIRHGTKTQTLDLVKEILEFIDIPEFFVAYESTDITTGLDFNFSKSHCIYPWINQLIDNGGNLRPCCLYLDDIKLENNTCASIASDDLKSVYLSDYMNTLRHDFLLGEKPNACQICWTNELNGIQSMRQQAKHKFRDIYYTLDYASTDFNNLQIFDLKLGNACNLTCKICNPFASDAVGKSYVAQQLLTKEEFNKIQESTSWSESDHFWDQMLSTVDNLRYLDLYGGEPLMSKKCFNFLKKLVDLGVAHKIKIDYNTNGTVYSDKFFDIWDHFKEVKLSFSIDDIEHRFEEQRTGASWEIVCKNIELYNSKKSDKFVTEVFPTINSQNVFWLPELIDWIETQKFDHMCFNILHTPEKYNIQSINEYDKKSIINKLKNYQHRSIIKTIIHMLEKEHT